MLEIKSANPESDVFARKGEAMPTVAVKAGGIADGRWNSMVVRAKPPKGRTKGDENGNGRKSRRPAVDLASLIHRSSPEVKSATTPLCAEQIINQAMPLEKFLDQPSAWPASAYGGTVEPLVGEAQDKKAQVKKARSRKRYQFTVRLNEELVHRFVELSVRSGHTYQHILERAVTIYLDHHATVPRIHAGFPMRPTEKLNGVIL